jgi:hypothetical protein
MRENFTNVQELNRFRRKIARSLEQNQVQ